MRILHTSDWHLGRMIEQVSRLDEQADFISEIRDICERESVDLLIISGDVFDTYNPPAAAETLFYEALEKLSGKGYRQIVVIAGNHDNPERLAAAAPLAYQQGILLLGYPASDLSDLMKDRRGLPDIVEAAGPGFVKIRPPSSDFPAVVLTLPYPSEARLSQLVSDKLDEGENQRNYSGKVGKWLKEMAGNWFSYKTVNLLAMHAFVQGGWQSDSERTLQLGSAVLIEPADLPPGAHYIALGHLHRPQSVTGSPSPARYAGSPLAYSFSESGFVKSVCLVDAWPGQPADIRIIPLSSGKPLRRWLAREGLQQATEWCRDGRDAGSWIDLEIQVDRILTTSELRSLRELNPNLVYIRPSLTGSDPVRLSALGRTGRKIEDLFAEFYKFRNGTPIPGAVMKVFLELLNQSPGEET